MIRQGMYSGLDLADPSGSAILVLRHIVGLITLEPDAKERAKVTGGAGKLSVQDAILILRYIVGLTDTFPAEER